jgi:hypothetical protein
VLRALEIATLLAVKFNSQQLRIINSLLGVIVVGPMKDFFFHNKNNRPWALSSSTSYQHDSTVFKTISPFDFDTMSFQ